MLRPTKRENAFPVHPCSTVKADDFYHNIFLVCYFLLLIPISTHHIQIATYTSGSALSWRTIETGELPTPRRGMRAVVVNNVVFVTGGNGKDNSFLTEILSWNDLQESWTTVGNMEVARAFHGAAPSFAIECPAMH